ncbi:MULTISPECIES: hypothetical protein [Aerosakkonema]
MSAYFLVVVHPLAKRSKRVGTFTGVYCTKGSADRRESYYTSKLSPKAA